MKLTLAVVLAVGAAQYTVLALVPSPPTAANSNTPSDAGVTIHRRAALGWLAGGAGAVAGWTLLPRQEAAQAAGETPDSFDVDSYLKSGFVQNPMGVSGQAGECSWLE